MRKIELTQGKVALVDSENYRLFADQKWHALRIPGRLVRDRWYAARSNCDTRVYMHNLVLDHPPGMVVDLINFNGLDNRRANLRLVTPSQNAAHAGSKGGTSKYRGVSWDSAKGMWVAGISPEGRSRRLGAYSSEESAARAYDEAALQCYGVAAGLNFPFDAPEVLAAVDDELGEGGYRPAQMAPRYPVNSRHPLFGKRIVFTGQLSMVRREAAQAAFDCGAKCTESVSHATDYVVVGGKDYHRYMHGQPSGRLQIAQALAATTGRPLIISESDFECLLAGDMPPS